MDITNASVHLYHHGNNDFFSHFIQILLEFSSLLAIIPISYILNINILNPWIVIFFYIFYTTVHNVNYSILHVNTIHEKHHKEFKTNLGPDICDIIFNTKYNIDEVENTDHYIVNIIVSYIIVIYLHKIWSMSSDNSKIIIQVIFGVFFTIITSILFYVTYYLKKMECIPKDTIDNKINEKCI
jgi:hypothetical protein